MAVNKVIYGSDTIIDITDSTVDVEHLIQGYTAYDKSGTKITGTIVLPSGSTNITTNGTYNVTSYASAIVNVPSQDNTLVITLSWDDDYFGQDDGAWIPDCTFSEIVSAYNAEKDIVVVTEDDCWCYCYVFVDEPIIRFVYSVSCFPDENMVTTIYVMDANEIVIDESFETILPVFETITRTYTPSSTQQTDTIIYDASQGYNGIEEVDVTINAIPSYDPTLDITSQAGFVTENNQRKWHYRTYFECYGGYVAPNDYYGNWNTYNAVPANTTVTPSTQAQTIGGTNYMMEGAVTVSAMPSGTAGTPTATKGTVSNHSVSVTPSVTNTTGYITGSTKTGTAVTVSASELVSGTLDVTSSGTKDVTNYASVSVPAGSVTSPSTINGTTATVSTGTNTITLTKSVSVTPNVTTAGYISTGTAGNSSVSLTASVTTKAAATITPGTSNQTIASGTYLTGTQTISGDSDLTAANIKSGISIFNVNGTFTSDATATASDIASSKTAYVNGSKLTGTLAFQTIYSGSSTPSSSLGVNGDVYIQA